MAKKLHAIGHAHIDPVWLWRWPEGLETIRATWRSALDRMNEYPDFRFSASSAWFYRLIEEVDPAMFSEIRERVQEGRWEIAGGWWVEPDANIPCGESLVRQALYGKKYIHERFGADVSVGFNPDTFGHPATLPQILAKTGYTTYVFMRPRPEEMDLPPVFTWRGPDGSEVSAIRLYDYNSPWMWGSDPSDASDYFHSTLHHADTWTGDYAMFYGVGDHGGGPTKAHIELIQRLRAAGEPVEFGTLSGLAQAIRDSGVQPPVVDSELQYHARGCYSAHSETKRHNRRVEHLLMAAERLSSMACLAVGREPRDLADAWQHLLTNQFHDVLAGTSLPTAYQDSRDFFGTAATQAQKEIVLATHTIAATVDTRGEGEALIVFNSLPWPVRTPIEVEGLDPALCDEDGNPTPIQEVQGETVTRRRRSCFVADLPPLGYRTYRKLPTATTESAMVVTPYAIESDRWVLEFDPRKGGLVNLLDKEHGVAALSGPVSLCVLDDQGDTWGHGCDSLGHTIGCFEGAEVAVEERGPVRACLRVESAYGRSYATQRWYVYAGLDVIECRLSVDWREQRRALKLALPLALREPTATYEVPYGCAERPCDGTEQPGGQWMDLSGNATSLDGTTIPYGIGLLNDGVYGFDAQGATMRATVLRSPIFAHHDPSEPSASQRYRYQDLGLHEFVFRLLPHAGTWQEAALPARAWELNCPPICVNEYVHEGTLPSEWAGLFAQPSNILLSVLKRAEDGGGLIVRGYETTGHPTGARIAIPSAGMEWRVAFGPHEILTWRVDVARGTVQEVDLLERGR
ncbi:MAG: hypothetical protein AMXMBFR61_22220 [Fimbriimonadales bacterium]